MLMKHSFSVATLALFLTTGAVGATTDPLPSQSPIDIITRQARYDPTLPELVFGYTGNATVDIVDTRPQFTDDGNATIRADVSSGSTLTIAGTVYNLLQFHLHALAEHEIDGDRGDMELHLVHRAPTNSDGTPGALAVVGQIIRIGQTANEALAPYFAALDVLSAGVPDLAPGTVPPAFAQVPDFDLTRLIPTDPSSYRYSGSLTAPSPGGENAQRFFEPVAWNVIAAPIEVSQEQYDAFARLFATAPSPNGDPGVFFGNAREVQDLNGRTVTTDVASIPLPATGALFVFALGGLAVLRRREAWSRGGPFAAPLTTAGRWWT